MLKIQWITSIKYILNLILLVMKILIKNNEDLQHIHKLFKKKENYN